MSGPALVPRFGSGVAVARPPAIEMTAGGRAAHGQAPDADAGLRLAVRERRRFTLSLTGEDERDADFRNPPPRSLRCMTGGGARRCDSDGHGWGRDGAAERSSYRRALITRPNGGAATAPGSR